ncbi:hypothetical protein MJ1HA_1952 [Metallosphaera sedula]|nr:hypothetical protein MJ1HA_1952 [Metallosphaera sedula]
MINMPLSFSSLKLENMFKILNPFILLDKTWKIISLCLENKR